MADIHVGILFPYSGIFRQIRQDFQRGFELGLTNMDRFKINIHAEFIEMGSQRQVEAALKKLLLFENVDFITGICGTLTMAESFSLLEQQRTPALLNNFGAYVPPRTMVSDYLFYNSLHLWQSQWIMGRWAQQQWAGEPSINTSLYDGGYHMHECFRRGTIAAGAETAKLNIVKNANGLYDISPLIAYISEQQPSHVHAILSGKESEDFLLAFVEKGLEERSLLSVSPFMVEESLSPRLLKDIPVYSACSWTLHLDHPANLNFIRSFEEAWSYPPNPVTLLGFESGLYLKAALQTLPERFSKKELLPALGEARPIGPRGPLSLSTKQLAPSFPVLVRRYQQSIGWNEVIAVEEPPALGWSDFAEAGQLVAGWQNPYLCV